MVDYVGGESRIEIEYKDEGILHISENEGNDTDDNDLELLFIDVLYYYIDHLYLFLIHIFLC